MILTKIAFIRSRTTGFSILELLATLGGIGIVASISLIVITPLLADVRKVKLDSDVFALNKAIKSYVVEGGDISAATTPEQVIALLRTSASNDETIAGYRGSYVDPRLELIFQTSEEAAEDNWRATYDTDNTKFVVTNSGNPGVKEFRLNEEAIPDEEPTEERDQAGKLAQEDQWIWDFTDTAPAPSLPVASHPLTTTPDPPAVNNPDALEHLLPPSFSPPGDLFEFFAFPTTVSLTNPNNAATTKLMYSLNGGAWQEYTAPIAIGPDQQISAYATSDPPDPEVYDSFIATQVYRRDDPELSGSSTGAFKNVIGGSNLDSSIAAGNSDSELLYGTALGAGGSQNRLEFTGSSFSNIVPEQRFTLGSLTYLNSTTRVGTAAYDVTLQLDLSFSSPAGTTESIDINLALESTKNYSWLTADQQADYVRFGDISTDFSAVFNGETYYLNLEFVYSGTDGYSTLDEFHVHEGASATAEIEAFFSTTPMELPDTSGGSSPGGVPSLPSFP